MYQYGVSFGNRPIATRSPQIFAQRSANSKMIAQGRYFEDVLTLLELELVSFSGCQVAPEAFDLITHRAAFGSALPSLELHTDNSNGDDDRQKWDHQQEHSW